MAAAGSAAGLLWALLLAFLPLPHARYAGEVSAALSLFNLLPIPVCDGGRILRSFGCPLWLLTALSAVLLVPFLLWSIRRRLWYGAALALWLLFLSFRQSS